jgi:GntR family histidine utilization transcriptional repressor
VVKPQYQKLKSYIKVRIDEGLWQEGHRVSSENELAEQFGVSRMTANRALKELSGEGVLTRVPGVGTFVAKYIPQAPLFEIRNIADEIRDRGHNYSAELALLVREAADQEVAAALELPVGAEVFHSVVIHRENGIPVQLEDRHVNPALVPHYIEQDFIAITPNEYLMDVAPLTEAEHIIEAILPDAKTRQRLDLDEHVPCILLRRRTWSGAAIASNAQLVYPGNRYRLGGRFVPEHKPVLTR